MHGHFINSSAEFGPNASVDIQTQVCSTRASIARFNSCPLVLLIKYLERTHVGALALIGAVQFLIL